jgi:hypothetical protein
MFDKSEGFFLWAVWRLFIASALTAMLVMFWLMIFMSIETHMDRQAILYQECGYPCPMDETR